MSIAFYKAKIQNTCTCICRTCTVPSVVVFSFSLLSIPGNSVLKSDNAILNSTPTKRLHIHT